MKKIELYIDEEKIKKETGVDFSVIDKTPDNYLLWLQYLVSRNKYGELGIILSNTYSEWEVKYSK